MRRSTTEVLRRGFDSTVANWPLIMIRIAESVFFVLVIVGSIFAMIVPIAVSAGLSHFDPGGRQPAEIMATLLVEHWILVVYLLLIVSVLLLLLVGIHSFVEAGSARVYVDAERLADASAVPTRDRFRSFSMERWMAGGRSSWWSVFWIYNLAWGIGGLILVVPPLATIAFMLLVSDNSARLAIGCAGLALTVLLMIPVVIVMAVWTQKAIVIAVARAANAAAALRTGWREIGGDAGRHIAVAVIVFAVSFGGAMVISMFSLPMNMARIHQPLAGLAFAPAQIGISVVQSIFTSAIGLWFLASYAGLTEERK